MPTPSWRAPLALTAAVFACLPAAAPLRAFDPEPEARRLAECGSSAPVPLPAEGVRFARDTASWELAAGTVRRLEPLVDGLPTGLVFSGQGRFRMTIPDPVERRHLPRVSETPELEAFDESFDALVLLTSGPLAAELLPAAEYPPGGASELAEERLRNWLVQRFQDVQARVLAGREIPGDDYLRVAMRTVRFGWLTWEWDPLDDEEVVVARYDPTADYTEEWIRLDRPEDRDARGRPSGVERRTFDLRHVEHAVDLSEPSPRWGKVGLGKIVPRRAQIEARLDLVPLVEEAGAVRLQLDPTAELTEVLDSEGRPVPFLRRHIGALSSALDDDLWDDHLWILPSPSLRSGEPRSFTFRYHLDVSNYFPGRSWYPGEEDGFRDPHTAAFEITALSKQEVRVMGRETGTRREEDGLWHGRWEVGSPTRMVTLAFGERIREKTVELEGFPTVTAFAASRSGQVYNVAVDVSNAVQFFQQLFDLPLPTDHLWVTGISAFHGQSFDGFLHLSELSIHSTSEGPTERFRAHETAHQWWGHTVAWRSYRDQWLSEAFAEYSAMLFLEAAFPEEEYYDEVVGVYAEQTLGRVHGASRFQRGWAMERNDRNRARIGPISLGYRASTGDSPAGYFGQSYMKGAVVLHMLRSLLRNATHSDDAFVQLLRTFLHRFAGGEASTADFQAVLTEVVPADWTWFFDQWIDDTALPTLRWSWIDAGPAPEGGERIELTVELSDVAQGFRTPVPVGIYFDRKRRDGGQATVLVQQAEETFVLTVPRPPVELELDPGWAVLARVEKR